MVRIVDAYRAHGFREFLRLVASYIHNVSVLYGVKSKYRLRSVRSDYDAVAPAFSIIEVDPNEIVFCYDHEMTDGGEFCTIRDAGKVCGGDWDRVEYRFEDTFKYRIMEEWVASGKSFSDTDSFRELATALENGTIGEIDGRTTREGLEERYDRKEELYRRIKTEGYKRQSELRALPSPVANVSEVAVHIGHDGELLFAGHGYHRLSVAKLLDLDSIPVRVVIRHSEWQEIRDEVYSTSDPDELSDEAKLFLDHPDIRGLR